MRLARRIFCQLAIFPASILFVIAAVGIFLLSLVEPAARIVVLGFLGRPVGEYQRWRVFNTPRVALRFVGFALSTVLVAHSARVGEI